MILPNFRFIHKNVDNNTRNGGVSIGFWMKSAIIQQVQEQNRELTMFLEVPLYNIRRKLILRKGEK